MNSIKGLGGILYYGNHEITPIIIDGKEVRYPRFFYGFSLAKFGWYALRRKGSRKYFRVVNFTHPYFAAGASTSGGFGVWFAAKDLVKAGGSKGKDTHRRYNGIFGEIGFWFWKFYLYIYLDGDGLG